MTSLTSRLVEPLYRIAYGPPLEGRPAVSAGDGDRTPGSARGLVLVADGVGGFDMCGIALRYVLAAEKLPYAVEIFPWGHGFGRWFADLTDAANRDAQARLLAEIVRRSKAERPSDPVFLVSKSGGSGVLVKALEMIEEQQVERAVMLAPALSPSYDLTCALRGVHRELVVFWSPLDVFILGMGTKVFGTADRVRTAGAGMRGFCERAGAGANENDLLRYEKLRQVRWHPRMAVTGHLGGHFGSDSPVFLRKYVVPLLRVLEAPGR